MTNLQLIVMISAYCGHQFDHFEKGTDIYEKQIRALLDAEMIKLANKNYNYSFDITPKGKAWLDHVLAIPYPVERTVWEIPK